MTAKQPQPMPEGALRPKAPAAPPRRETPEHLKVEPGTHHDNDGLDAMRAPSFTIFRVSIHRNNFNTAEAAVIVAEALGDCVVAKFDVAHNGYETATGLWEYKGKRWMELGIRDMAGQPIREGKPS